MGGLFPKNSVIRAFIAVNLTAISVLLILPFMLSTAAALILIRFCLTWYKNRWKSEIYGDLLSRGNNMFAGDNPYKDPLLVVSSFVIIEGKMTLPFLRQTIFDAHERFRAQGLYPELRQELTNWCGFHIWKNLPDHDPRNHVRVLDQKVMQEFGLGALPVTDETLADVAFKLTKIPLRRHTSPWDIYMCNDLRLADYTDREVSVIIFRFHHCLGDGLAFLQYFTNLVQGPDMVNQYVEKVKKSVPKIKRSLVEQLWYFGSYPVTGLYEAFQWYLEIWDSNEWTNPTSGIRKEYQHSRVAKLPLDDIKLMRKVQGGVKFYSVALGALTGGIRKYMIQNGVQVPESMSALVSVPIPTKEVRLSNNVTCIIYQMPVSWNNRNKIVHSIERQSIALKTSRFPMIMLGVFSYLGLLPSFFKAPPWLFTTCASSNVPGFEQQMTFQQYTMLDILGNASLNSNCGIYYWCVGYAGHLNVYVGVSTDIIQSRHKLKEFCACVADEFDALKVPNDYTIVT